MNIVIIGGGMAGCKLAQSLLAEHQENQHITLISKEPNVGYNRILLSSLLADDISESQMAFVDIEHLRARGVTIIAGQSAVAVDSINKQVTLANGDSLLYDKLVFATGSRPASLAFCNSSASNVMAFRTWQDVEVLSSLPAQQKIAVIGGGLLGLEAAVGLAKKGHQVTVFHRADFIMNRQLDKTAAQLLQAKLEAMGIRFCLRQSPTRTASNTQNKVTHLKTNEGQSFAVDHVILAIGITPETQLAQQAGLKVDRAITVDATMQTSHKDIFALGECCEFNQTTFGLVAPIWEQVNVLVNTLLSRPDHFSLRPMATQLKVSGINLFSMGELSESSNRRTITFLDKNAAHYRKILVENNQIVGVILYGNVTDGAWYSSLILEKTNIKIWLDRLVFGQAYCEPSAA